MELKQKERGKKIHLQSTDSFSSAKIPQKVRFLSLHIHKRVKKVGGGIAFSWLMGQENLPCT